MRQIIINLLSNAFKFTAEGAVTLEIRSATKDELLDLADSYTGNLLPSPSRILELGFQKKSSRLSSRLFNRQMEIQNVNMVEQGLGYPYLESWQPCSVVEL